MSTSLCSKIETLIDFIAYYDDHDDDQQQRLTIKGLIFDFGSVLCHSTKQSVKTSMQNALRESAQKMFNLTSDQSNEFLAAFKKYRVKFKQRKLFMGSGTCLDEGFVLEHTVRYISVSKN